MGIGFPDKTKRMKPLLKRERCNMPLSIETSWRDYFDQAAQTLRMSRNGVLCFTLSLGGPMLAKYIAKIRADMMRECKGIESGPLKSSEFVGIPKLPIASEACGHERSNKRARNRR
jgi:hypothetical protein